MKKPTQILFKKRCRSIEEIEGRIAMIDEMQRHLALQIAKDMLAAADQRATKDPAD